MDCSNDIHDLNDVLPHTRALPSLSQPLSSKDPGYDSEEEHANHVASLDISDESKVSVSLIDTHMSKLRFQWNPILLRNQCGARSQAGTSMTWRTAAVASKVLRCRLSSHTLRSDLQGAILLGKVRHCLSSCGQVTKFCSAKFRARFPTARTQTTCPTSLR
jgi:hypothetical protein